MRSAVCHGLLIGCVVGCHGTVETSVPPRQPSEAKAPGAVDEVNGLLVADRGVGHGSDHVWVIARWRSQVEPRGVVVVVPGVEFVAAELAEVGNRLMDERWNFAFVEPGSHALEKRVEVGTMIANEKSLGTRQWLENGAARRPTLTVLWVDDRDEGRAIELMRRRPPFMVQMAVVLTAEGSVRRRTITGEYGEVRVLEMPVTRGARLDAAGWAEVLRFIDEVEREVLPGDSSFELHNQRLWQPAQVARSSP